MIADRIKRRMKAGCAAIVLIAAGASLVWLDMPQASAQAIMRPNLNVAPRIPTVNPTIAPRIDPNIAARTNTVTGIDRITPHVTPTTTAISRLRVNPNSTMPYARFSPNLHPACEAAYREGDGECKGTPVASGDGGSGKPAKGKGKGKGPNSNPLWPPSRSASPTSWWPRSTARCRRSRPTHWRGATAWCWSSCRISR